MSKYIYPAVFTKEDQGYSISFPNIDSCYTQGDDLLDGIEMAKDVLCLVLYKLEEENKSIPIPSSPKEISTNDNSFVTLIDVDTLEYRKFYDSKSVKKTLTIPNWLNTMAEKNNINFSNVLQNALIEKLNIAE